MRMWHLQRPLKETLTGRDRQAWGQTGEVILGEGDGISRKSGGMRNLCGLGVSPFLLLQGRWTLQQCPPRNFPALGIFGLLWPGASDRA